jgi:hypothetical protein
MRRAIRGASVACARVVRGTEHGCVVFMPWERALLPLQEGTRACRRFDRCFRSSVAAITVGPLLATPPLAPMLRLLDCGTSAATRGSPAHDPTVLIECNDHGSVSYRCSCLAARDGGRCRAVGAAVAGEPPGVCYPAGLPVWRLFIPAGMDPESHL